MGDFSLVAAAHRALVEQVVEVDLVRRALPRGGDVDASELHATARTGPARRHLIPDLLVSARNGAGCPELLDVIEPHAAEPERRQPA